MNSKERIKKNQRRTKKEPKLKRIKKEPKLFLKKCNESLNETTPLLGKENTVSV